MSNEERAAVMNQQEIVALLAAHQNITRQYSQLAQKYEELQQQMDWFKRQLFGTKSERRVLPADCRQLTLGEMLGDA